MNTYFLASIPDFHPLIPPLLTLPCVLLIAVLTLIYYLKTPDQKKGLKLGLLGLRLTSLTLITFLLLGPQWYDMQAAQEEELSVHVVVDLSQSMQRPVSSDDTRTRSEAWKQEFLTLVKNSPELAHWKWWGLGDKLQAMTLDQIEGAKAEHPDSPLLEAMTTMVQQQPGQSRIILISDGADTSDPALIFPLRQLASFKRTSISTLRTGEADNSPQLQLQFLAEKDLLFQGESTALQLMLQYKALEKGQWTIELIHEGEKLDQRTFDVSTLRSSKLFSFQVSPRLKGSEKRSLHHYQIKVIGPDPQGPSPTIKDADTHAFITVTGQRIRTLLLEGRPHWDSRFMARVLAEDPRIDLTTVIAYSQWHSAVKHYETQSTEEIGASPSAPEDIQEIDLSLNGLRQYDVILLGRGMERFFPEDESRRLVDYVSSGGALFLMRGEAFPDDPLANETLNQILPLTWAQGIQEDQQIQRAINTEKLLPDIQGLSLQRLPRLTALYQDQKLAPQALIFLDTGQDQQEETQAILVAGPYGQGRVMAWLTMNSWRWAFMSPDQDELRTVYKSLHQNALRWLAYGDELTPEAELTMTVTPTQADLNEFIQVRVTSPWTAASALELSQLKLEVMDANGKQIIETLTLEPEPAQADQLQAQWSTDQAGIYRMRLTDQRQGDRENAKVMEVPFLVSNQSPDYLIHEPRPDFLDDFSLGAPGSSYSINEAEQLLEVLHSHNQILTENSLTRSSLAIPWIQWLPISFLILASFTLEWFIRRRSGLA